MVYNTLTARRFVGLARSFLTMIRERGLDGYMITILQNYHLIDLSIVVVLAI